MSQKFTYGIYKSVSNAQDSVKRLRDAGLPGSAITAIADDNIVDNYSGDINMIPSSEYYKTTEKNRSIWFARLFSLDNINNTSLPKDPEKFKHVLDNHEIIILVDGNYADQVGNDLNSASKNEPNYSDFAPHQEKRDQSFLHKNLRTAYRGTNIDQSEKRYDRPDDSV